MRTNMSHLFYFFVKDAVKIVQVFFNCKRNGMCGKDPRRTENNAKSPTVKLLLTFFVLDSATLASVRSTSSKIMDCKEKIQNLNKFLNPMYKQQTQKESA